ncbi:GtrA family protein [Arthrobacter sp. HLT1-20]
MATQAATEQPPEDPALSTASSGAFVVPRQWWSKYPVLAAQLRGFAVVAVICTVISMSIFASLRPLLGLQWANTISLVLCSVLNTDLNRRMSFGITGRALWWRDQRRGLWVMMLALFITSGSLWVLHQVLPTASLLVELVVIVAGNVASAVTRFLMMRYWIFRRLRRPAATHQRGGETAALR